MALGIKAAALVYGLDYGTVETGWRCESKQHKRSTRKAKIEKREPVAEGVVVAIIEWSSKEFRKSR